jgi:hypothetical protein
MDDTRFSRLAGGKRSPAARQGGASALLDWAEWARLALIPELGTTLQDGFGSAPAGEDAFDAVVGLFGMLNLVLGLRPLEEPAGWLRKIEDWILGQSCPVTDWPRILYNQYRFSNRQMQRGWERRLRFDENLHDGVPIRLQIKGECPWS